MSLNGCNDVEDMESINELLSESNSESKSESNSESKSESESEQDNKYYFLSHVRNDKYPKFSYTKQQILDGSRIPKLKMFTTKYRYKNGFSDSTYIHLYDPSGITLDVYVSCITDNLENIKQVLQPFNFNLGQNFLKLVNATP
jgi:hypothetical protein